MASFTRTTGPDVVSGLSVEQNVLLLNLVRGGADHDTLIGGPGDDQMFGGAGNDQFNGGDGDDFIDGGPGVDGMGGGEGDDTYVVDSVNDAIYEAAGEGFDIALVSADNYVLADNVEVASVSTATGLTVAGNAGHDILAGNSGADRLFGRHGNDQLAGGGGDDFLDGGAGDDSMGGGLGNDTYVVDSLADGVSENAGEGAFDRMLLLVNNATLAANVEIGAILAAGGLTVFGNDGDNIFYGNSGADTFLGRGGNDQFAGDGGDDYIDGGAGSDAMGGGAGNDTYVVDSLADTVFENPGEGAADRILAAANNYVVAANVEIGAVVSTAGLTLTASGTGSILFGNDGADTLIGGAGLDQFSGGLGDDTIVGGAGDAMGGGAGNDTLVIGSGGFGGIDGQQDFDIVRVDAGALDLTTDGARILNIEAIALNGSDLSLAGTDIAGISGGTNTLYVTGTGSDTVAAGNGWTLLAAGVADPQFPGVSFLHYVHASGSTLFVSDQVPLTIGAFMNQTPTILLGGLDDGFNFAATYTAGDTAGVGICDTDVFFDDPDVVDTPDNSSKIALLTATFDFTPVAGEHLELTAAGDLLAFNNGLTVTGEGTGALEITGLAADSVYRDLLKEIRYVNLDALFSGTRDIIVDTEDGLGADADERTATITVDSAIVTGTGFDDSMPVRSDPMIPWL
jgi:Ca2+-binding RTX toxin-like protein